ncbi:hypothetical protein F3J15_38270, partial [Burkholderia sp. Ap-955]|nr:hypothetical protein [Burkholderia sp. Ap-955]
MALILNLILDPLRFARPDAPGRRAGVALGALAALAVCGVLAGCSPQDDTARTDDTPEAASSASVPSDEPDTGWRYIRIRASAADAVAPPASMSARASQDPWLA